jgi:spoIIIJ-associated protein
MKDQVFQGPDVAAAKAAAAKALGVAEESLRVVVLDAGAPAGLGLTARPARIAVLVAALAAAAPPPQPAEDWRALLERLLGQLRQAAGVPLAFSLTETGELVTLHLSGAPEFLLEDEASLVDALEHLLQRALSERLDKRLVVDCEGYRDQREAALRQKARAWAAEVRRTGQPRETPPLNAYERRLVHMAVAEEPGLRTFSVGEGAGRRVTIAPAEPAER